MLNGFGPVGFALDQIEDTHFQIRRAMTSNPEHDNGADTRGCDGGVALAARRNLVCLLDNVGVEYQRAEKQPLKCSPKM